MILSVDELREHVNSGLGDPALQRLLDAAEEAIIARAGATGARTEYAGGGSLYVTLSRPAASITSVTETLSLDDTVLATDDYLIGAGEMLMERLSSGTNPRMVWGDRVAVVYSPVSDDATRAKVQIDLCKLALDVDPGVTEEQIGDWSQKFSGSLQEESDKVLAQLTVGLGMVVIG